MDLNDLHPPDDYSTRFFIWHEWIQVRLGLLLVIQIDGSTQANGPLTAENVFEYFATSMFYDKQSNNQVLRMQTIHTGVPLVNEAEELKSARREQTWIGTHVHFQTIYRCRICCCTRSAAILVHYTQT